VSQGRVFSAIVTIVPPSPSPSLVVGRRTGAADVRHDHDGRVVAAVAAGTVGRSAGAAGAAVRLGAKPGGHLGQVSGRLVYDGYLGGLDGAGVLAVRLGRGQVVGGPAGAVVAAVAARGRGHPVLQVEAEQRRVQGARLAGLARLERGQGVRQVFDVALGRCAAAARAVLPLSEQRGRQQPVGPLYRRVAQRRRVVTVVVRDRRRRLHVGLRRRRQQALAVAAIRRLLGRGAVRVAGRRVRRTARVAPRVEHPVVQPGQRLVFRVVFRYFLAAHLLLARTARHGV